LQHATGLGNKDDGVAFLPGFFYPSPVLAWPLGHGLLVTFTGTTLGILGSPAQATQEMLGAKGTIGDAKGWLHASGKPGTSSGIGLLALVLVFTR
jgi:hypothetical protein